MSGYTYDQREPLEACPYCDTLCHADFVDVGIGMQQCGPYHCESCGASEMGPFDADRPLTEKERKTGWYEPGSMPSSSANVIGGKVVGHKEMLQVYRDEFTANPLHAVPGHVDEWREKVRKEGLP